jgi:BirA family transcriptional regulator, biotin operon repressor / biotin---[acetyl-CoA-carboxylase] ligase
MLTEPLVTEAVRAAHLGAPVHFLGETESTNSDLLRLAEEGAPQWTIVVANHQKAGRGRLGRTWVSTPGSSLLSSVLLRPSLLPVDAPLLTLGAGAAMALACFEASGVDTRCRWPNDLVVGKAKLGGVLVEAKVQEGRVLHAVVGAGVNLTQSSDDFPAEVRDMATSVALEGGRADALGLLTRYLIHLSNLIDTSSAGYRGRLFDAYLGVCATLGRRVRATTTLGAEVVGRAVGVGNSGELLVETGSGVSRVGFGEIGHLD